LKEEALDHTLWRTYCGRGYGPIVRQNTEGINECIEKEKCYKTLLKIDKSDSG